MHTQKNSSPSEQSSDLKPTNLLSLFMSLCTCIWWTVGLKRKKKNLLEMPHPATLAKLQNKKSPLKKAIGSER